MISVRFLGVFESAKRAYQALTGKVHARGRTFDMTLSTEEVYSLRRDIAGKPPTRIARAKASVRGMQLVGTMYMRLVEAGATFEGAEFVL
jgi:hypothetical protein